MIPKAVFTFFGWGNVILYKRRYLGFVVDMAACEKRNVWKLADSIGPQNNNDGNDHHWSIGLSARRSVSPSVWNIFFRRLQAVYAQMFV